jgi:adenylate cyclase
MARQYSVTGNVGDARRSESIIRICQRATEIDPEYAHAWALMANAQGVLRFHHARNNDGGLAAAERAIALDADLAEAHAARGRVLTRESAGDEAEREIETASSGSRVLRSQCRGGGLCYRTRRFAEAIRHYDKAATVMETDYNCAGMIVSCYKAVGDEDGVLRSARRSLERTEKIIAQDPDNGSALSFAVGALAALGETERAKEWAERAMLLDPDNINMKYNFACMLVTDLHDHDAALDLLEPLFVSMRLEVMHWVKTDPDLDAIRDHPRFRKMAAAEARSHEATKRARGPRSFKSSGKVRSKMTSRSRRCSARSDS